MKKIPQVFSEYFPKLNIADIDVLENTVGPGKRVAIWLQGCISGCSGCSNQDFLPLKKAALVDPDVILQMCRNNKVEGISLSGGEPFLQALQLYPFVEQARAQGLTVFAWSGYLLGDLRIISEPKEIAGLLKHIDILVDGLYHEREKDSLLWRGSQNQHVHFLSDHYSPELIKQPPRCSMHFCQRDGLISGDINEELLMQFRENLERYGITIRTHPNCSTE